MKYEIIASPNIALNGSHAPKWCLNGTGHSTMWSSLAAQMTMPTAMGSPTLQVRMDSHLLISFFPDIWLVPPYPSYLPILVSAYPHTIIMLSSYPIATGASGPFKWTALFCLRHRHPLHFWQYEGCRYCPQQLFLNLLC